MSEQSAAQRVLADLQPKIGQEIHCSDWLLVSQRRIDDFAQAISDYQWIHTDPVRVARESPWKTTIAHGYLTLSLYPLLRGLVDAGKPLFPGATCAPLRAAQARRGHGRPAADRAVHGRDRR
jgi:acyl dehydratase